MKFQGFCRKQFPYRRPLPLLPDLIFTLHKCLMGLVTKAQVLFAEDPGCLRERSS